MTLPATPPAAPRCDTRQAALLLEQAKWCYNARRVDRSRAQGLSPHVERARIGDLVLCKIAQIGQHKRLQLASGRYAENYVEDLFIAPCGARYAPDQFEGVAEIAPDGADLLAAGGIVGRMRCANASMGAPTRVHPLGLALDAAGRPINIADFALRPQPRSRRIPVFVVVGASMNAGKTTATASFAHGLRRGGRRVAALKATGSGAFGDMNAFHDAGIPIVADFTDMGLPSTYTQPIERLETVFDGLLDHAAAQGADVAVVEFADGVLQPETRALLASPRVRAEISGVLYAASDAAGAILGARELRSLGVEPMAVSGMVTRSPLAMREAAAATSVTFLTRDQLRDPKLAAAAMSAATPIATGAPRANGYAPRRRPSHSAAA